jgi:hypothetical protein
MIIDMVAIVFRNSRFLNNRSIKIVLISVFADSSSGGLIISQSDRSFRLWIPTTMIYFLHERGKMGLK